MLSLFAPVFLWPSLVFFVLLSRLTAFFHFLEFVTIPGRNSRSFSWTEFFFSSFLLFFLGGFCGFCLYLALFHVVFWFPPVGFFPAPPG